MSDQNVFHFTGRLTRDVQLSFTPSQHPVADVGVAIGRKYKDKDEVVFLDLRVWGPPAEVWNKYFRKGSFVIASGRLVMEQWTAKDGQKRSKLLCVVENFTFPPKTGNGQPQPGENIDQDAPQAGDVSGPARSGPPVPDEDIPF